MKDRNTKPADPNWKPAQTYPTSMKMVEDLQAHNYAYKVLLDGGDVVQFSLNPPPILNYYTQADWSVGQQHTSGQPTGDGTGTTGQAGVLPWGGHVYTGVPPYPSMKGDDLYKLSLTVPADWPTGPNMNTISIGEHGSSGGPQARNVKFKDGTGSLMYEVMSDTYPSIPYCVGGPAGADVITLMPGGVYYIEIFNNGPLGEGATYPPVTDMVVQCYLPAK